MTKVLLTGATGYIGKRLLPLLVKEGYEVYIVARDKRRVDLSRYYKKIRRNIHVFSGDFNDTDSLKDIPLDFDIAFYLIHSLGVSMNDFQVLEESATRNFSDLMTRSAVKQIIYLGGIANDLDLSRHLASRRNVEEILKLSGKPVTVLRAAIIIGSGSSSFEIIRDLVEKLPVMVTPKWLNSRCEPIAVANVLTYLMRVILLKETYNQTYDIGGPDILTYREMLQILARVRKLKRFIITFPVPVPQLSSLWIYLVTSTSLPLAKNLVDSIKNEVICNENRIHDLIPIKLYNYEKAIKRAFMRIEQNQIVSSWKDAINNPNLDKLFLNFINVPIYGCYTKLTVMPIEQNRSQVVENIWTIGGNRGWYYGNLLWQIRGLMDTFVGGVGLRRGRRNPVDLVAGDALDFWRVLLADKVRGRLLLYAEMKLPGEAWLEFNVSKKKKKSSILYLKATFRPKGIFGRIYWYALLPIHLFMFRGMARNIANYRDTILNKDLFIISS